MNNYKRISELGLELVELELRRGEIQQYALVYSRPFDKENDKFMFNHFMGIQSYDKNYDYGAFDPELLKSKAVFASTRKIDGLLLLNIDKINNDQLWIENDVFISNSDRINAILK